MNSFASFVRTGLLCLATAALPLSSGCGMDVEVGSTSGTGGIGGGSTSSGGGSGNVASTSATGGGGGASCGSAGVAACAADEYCDFPNNICGADDGHGTCVKRPTLCGKNISPTCGCDGQIHDNQCEAYTAGVDLSAHGSCKAPAGQFSCGEHFCDQATQYCQKQLSDIANDPDSYTCSSLPGACGATPSCACLAAVQCGGACAATSDGGLLVTCPGG